MISTGEYETTDKYPKQTTEMSGVHRAATRYGGSLLIFTCLTMTPHQGTDAFVILGAAPGTTTQRRSAARTLRPLGAQLPSSIDQLSCGFRKPQYILRKQHGKLMSVSLQTTSRGVGNGILGRGLLQMHSNNRRGDGMMISADSGDDVLPMAYLGNGDDRDVFKGSAAPGGRSEEVGGRGSGGGFGWLQNFGNGKADSTGLILSTVLLLTSAAPLG